jgi:hypothetical protein
VLLHFKFFTNYRNKITEAASNKQHYNGSQHYQALKREIDNSGVIKFVGESSIRESEARANGGNQGMRASKRYSVFPLYLRSILVSAGRQGPNRRRDFARRNPTFEKAKAQLPCS